MDSSRGMRILQRAASTLWIAFALLGATTRARADDKSGVSPTRLHLPKGPGSLEGIGENAQPELSMGLMTYGVTIAMPSGYESMTPSLRLTYNSGSGNSEVGIGWSLPVPTIDRMTARGLPRYTPDDTFAANGGDELVRLPSSNTYRTRYEGGFVRYTWIDAPQTGQRGYWTAEYPDGRVGYFGAHKDGTPEPTAVAAGPNGIFRYYVVDVVDVLSHVMTYEYELDGALPELRRVAYVFSAGVARYEAKVTYENRNDEVSDAKPGFDLRCTRRVHAVQVLARGQQVRRYSLAYENPGASAGLSRLSAVYQYGVGDDGPYPIVFGFSYSGGLGAACTTSPCNAPTFVDTTGSLGVDLRASTADLVDINGDALPDFVDTGQPNHTFFINQLASDGTQRFSNPKQSQFGSMQLSNHTVQLVDLNGDGFSDMVDGPTSTSGGPVDPSARNVLWNRGTGDWQSEQLIDGLNLPDFAEDLNLRFLDYNNDKRIDVFHADSSATWVWENQGNGHFVQVSAGFDAIGAGFTDGLQLADMNGDGMQDIVQFAMGLVSYRLNLGWGHWSKDWIEMKTNSPTMLSGTFQFVDLNGDSLADLVSVQADAVLYAINRSGLQFDNVVSLAASSSLPLPVADANMSIRFADMNGSGSTDVVYVDPSGHVSYLELFPERPNLLKHITNGIGKVIDVTYGSSVQHMVRDGGAGAWQYHVPHPMLTVDRIETSDTLSGIKQVQSFHYKNGYYDGTEKQFRGFIDVEVTTTGDMSMEPGLARHHFEVGEKDPYRKGLLLDQVTQSGGRDLGETQNQYADCTLDGVPSTTPAVRFVCPQGTTQIVKEGTAQGSWVNIDERYGYDGYGNRTRTAKLGVTAIGGGACGPCTRPAGSFGAACGAQCAGDEAYEDTTFVSPSSTGGRWILHKPARKRVSGVDGSAGYHEEVYHYDGYPFVGLPADQLTQGLLSRTEANVQPGDPTTIDTQRARYDANGAVVEVWDPNGHRRGFEYDPDSLLVTSETQFFDDAGHSPYALRMQASYDPVQDTIASSTQWMRVVGGNALSAPRSSSYGYDHFGRLVAIARPGDTVDAPTEAYQYDLGDPASRIVRRGRSQSGGDTDLEEVQCFDGLGRKYETRTRIGGDTFQISGFTVFNLQGKAQRQYQPSLGMGDRCDQSPPADARYMETLYDATGRPLTVIQPDADLYGGTASRAQTEYAPLHTIASDEEDTNVGGLYANTPLVTWTDGLGRTVGYDRYLVPNQPVHLELTYDELGHLRGYVDVKGNTKIQEYDLLGRVTRIQDPDSGVTTFTYDPAGNKLTEVDARNVQTQFSYDEANRLTAEWDASNAAGTVIRYDYDAVDGCSQCTNVEGMVGRIRYPMADDGSVTGEDLMGYDARGQATFLARTMDGHRFEFATTYDDAGRVTDASYPAGQSLHYTLDAMGRVAAIPGYVDHVDYEPRGPMQTLSLANGVTTTYGYDARTRLASLNTVTPKGETIQDYSYLRDRVGNIGTLTDHSAFGDAPSANASYTYDAWYRLKTAHLDPGRPQDELLKFDYDAIDNILTKTSSLGAKSPDHVGSYTYGVGAGPHAVTTAGKMAFQYDPAGNMTRHGQDTYAWDFMGRLTRAARDATELGRYTYGAARDRVKKVEAGHTAYYVTPDFEVRDGTAVLYVRIAGQPIAKVQIPQLNTSVLPDIAPAHLVGHQLVADPDGVITSADAWIAQAKLTNVFDLAVSVDDSVIDGLLAASTRAELVAPPNEVFWVHSDHLQSMCSLSDTHGTVIGKSLRFAFGEARLARGTFGEDNSFTGKEPDPNTGLLYFGTRYLDPVLGRWPSADAAFGVLSIEHLGRLSEASSRYAFALNNPINHVDPDGAEDEKADSHHEHTIENMVELSNNTFEIAHTWMNVEEIAHKGLELMKEPLSKVLPTELLGPAVEGAGVAAGAYSEYHRKGLPEATTRAGVGLTSMAIRIGLTTAATAAAGALCGASGACVVVAVGATAIALGHAARLAEPIIASKINRISDSISKALFERTVDEQYEYARRQPVSLINDYQRAGVAMPLELRTRVLNGLVDQNISWPTKNGTPLGFGYRIP
jgi:RHS repeat-associated protein